MATNIIASILSELEVPYTSDYLNNLFDNHPYRYTLYGIKSMLKHYNIDSYALHINEHAHLIEFNDTVPFVVQIYNDLAVVSRIEAETIHIITYGKHQELSHKVFFELWTGVALILLPFQDAHEPDFRTNRINQLWIKTEYVLICMLSVVFMAHLWHPSDFLTNSWLITQLLLSICGLFFSSLLLLDFLKIETTIGNRICTSIKGHSCANLLELPAAKLVGRYSWSEIGVSYFLTTIFLILIAPETSYTILPAITILSSIYPIWSIWYQKYKAKKWCTLCLLVQGVLISQCAITICTSTNLTAPPSLTNILLALLSYVLCGLIVHTFIRLYLNSEKYKLQAKVLSLIKYKNETFNIFLTAQPKTAGFISSVVFGPENAKYTISVYVNPLCAPCVKTHPYIDELHKVGCRIRYYFTSFNDEVAPITHKLISYYFSHSEEETWDLFTQWYANGYLYGEHFLDKFNILVTSESIKEAEAHVDWAKFNHLDGTPTIIFNNHHLPKEYSIDDVIFYVKANL